VILQKYQLKTRVNKLYNTFKTLPIALLYCCRILSFVRECLCVLPCCRRRYFLVTLKLMLLFTVIQLYLRKNCIWYVQYIFIIRCKMYKI